MWVALTQLALFVVVVVNVSTAAGQVAFAYRFYDTIQCDHNAPPQSTFPRNGASAFSGTQDQCISGPSGGNWNVLEVSNPGGLNLFTFCGMNCQGTMSPAQSSNIRCFSPAAPNCNIGSFMLTAGTPTPPAVTPTPPAVTNNPPTPTKNATPVLQTSSAAGTSSPTQASQTSKSTTENATSSPLGAATGLPAQSSNTSTPATPNASSALQIPLVGATSPPTQSTNTSKSNLKAIVVGGVVGGVIALAALIFLLYFLRRRAMKRKLNSLYDVPVLATPTFFKPPTLTPLTPFPAGTIIDQSTGPHFTPVLVQTTGKFVRADRNSGSAYSGNTSSAYGGLQSPLAPVRKGDEARLLERESLVVESPPAYTRQMGA